MTLEELADRDALLEDVRDLGYAGAADPAQGIPPPLTNTSLPDPRDRMDELARFYDATLARNRGDLDEAIRMMRAVVDGNPRNVYATNVLATFLLEEQRYQDAVDLLLALPPDRRDRLNVQDCLGHAFEALGQPERALSCFERALALKPGDAHQEEDVRRTRAAVGNGGR